MDRDSKLGTGFKENEDKKIEAVVKEKKYTRGNYEDQSSPGAVKSRKRSFELSKEPYWSSTLLNPLADDRAMG